MTSIPVLMSNILLLVILYIFPLVLLEHSGNAELLATKALSERKAQTIVWKSIKTLKASTAQRLLLY
jgi:hypothetical protein